MKKKLLSALLAFALSLGTATIPAAAAEVDSAGGQVSAQLNTVSLNGRTSSNVDRHRNNADVRLNGAKRIVGALRTCIGNGVKQRTFSDVRKSYDT